MAELPKETQAVHKGHSLETGSDVIGRETENDQAAKLEQEHRVGPPGDVLELGDGEDRETARARIVLDPGQQTVQHSLPTQVQQGTPGPSDNIIALGDPGDTARDCPQVMPESSNKGVDPSVPTQLREDGGDNSQATAESQERDRVYRFWSEVLDKIHVPPLDKSPFLFQGMHVNWSYRHVNPHAIDQMQDHLFRLHHVSHFQHHAESFVSEYLIKMAQQGNAWSEGFSNRAFGAGQRLLGQPEIIPYRVYGTPAQRLCWTLMECFARMKSSSELINWMASIRLAPDASAQELDAVAVSFFGEGNYEISYSIGRQTRLQDLLRQEPGFKQFLIQLSINALLGLESSLSDDGILNLSNVRHLDDDAIRNFFTAQHWDYYQCHTMGSAAFANKRFGIELSNVLGILKIDPHGLHQQVRDGASATNAGEVPVEASVDVETLVEEPIQLDRLERANLNPGYKLEDILNDVDLVAPDQLMASKSNKSKYKKKKRSRGINQTELAELGTGDEAADNAEIKQPVSKTRGFSHVDIAPTELVDTGIENVENMTRHSATENVWEVQGKKKRNARTGSHYLTSTSSPKQHVSHVTETRNSHKGFAKKPLQARGSGVRGSRPLDSSIRSPGVESQRELKMSQKPHSSLKKAPSKSVDSGSPGIVADGIITAVKSRLMEEPAPSALPEVRKENEDAKKARRDSVTLLRARTDSRAATLEPEEKCMATLDLPNSATAASSKYTPRVREDGMRESSEAPGVMESSKMAVGDLAGHPRVRRSLSFGDTPIFVGLNLWKSNPEVHFSQLILRLKAKRHYAEFEFYQSQILPAPPSPTFESHLPQTPLVRPVVPENRTFVPVPAVYIPEIPLAPQFASDPGAFMPRPPPYVPNIPPPVSEWDDRVYRPVYVKYRPQVPAALEFFSHDMRPIGTGIGTFYENCEGFPQNVANVNTSGDAAGMGHDSMGAFVSESGNPAPPFRFPHLEGTPDEYYNYIPYSSTYLCGYSLEQ